MTHPFDAENEPTQEDLLDYHMGMADPVLAKKIDAYQANFSDQAFMVGMLSLADAVMQTSLEDVLNEIGLSDELRNAILNQEGTLGQLLKLANLIEHGDFDSAEQEIAKLGISSDDLLQIQLETMQWANEIGKEPI